MSAPCMLLTFTAPPNAGCTSHWHMLPVTVANAERTRPAAVAAALEQFAAVFRGRASFHVGPASAPVWERLLLQCFGYVPQDTLQRLAERFAERESVCLRDRYFDPSDPT